MAKKNCTEFSFKAFRSEIQFHTNPGLSQASFEQPGPVQDGLFKNIITPILKSLVVPVI